MSHRLDRLAAERRARREAHATADRLYRTIARIEASGADAEALAILERAVAQVSR